MKATICLGIAFALSATPALACSQLEPAAAFIFINDTNRDRYLQAAEIGFDNVRYIRPPCADMEERRFMHGLRQRAN